ncbi:MAG: methyl-accepting chemotaxis protein [Candidatus Fibromonas sp.]|jgi:iron only hydrogenase large subunit-like protein|nr:methyl-accepting chemotaxis protein [Candidatus Fibromonas sp.]
MRNIITNDLDKCVGCNRCVRVCPIYEANFAWSDGKGNVKVKIESSKCVACGSCLEACHHGSRHYEDDTERFFSDLRSGVPISVFAAPAVKSNFEDYGRLFTWLRSLGVKTIYDVSLGADICTWAHIRYIQKNGPKPIISQPCPAIVNYILIHRNGLIKHLSPVHSPMLCTAVYMNKYEKVGTKIAALSPCVAKSYEFEATRLVEYNVTFKKLNEYMKRNNVKLPPNSSKFDNYEAGLGSLYPMPGGLKESVEFYAGKKFRIDKSEGPHIVYKMIGEYARQPVEKLPVLFDVLNCQEGCNAGTGCVHGKDFFEINVKMDELRQAAIKENNVQYVEDLFKKFDETLKLDDFLRQYIPTPVSSIRITPDKIEQAFIALGKYDKESRDFSCGACGCNNCLDMAWQVAKGINITENCAKKMHDGVTKEHNEAKSLSKSNLSSFETILGETSRVKNMMGGIVSNMESITSAIASYDRMVTDIERISEKVNIIALNASVEAAKAGQHGLAFGVVAKEIRNLAQSSADSAMRTKEASEKANSAIKTVNKTVLDINETVKESYENIETASESTRKLLQEQDV